MLPYGINKLIVMQPNFQARYTTASPNRFLRRDSGCFRNRRCRDHKLCDDAPFKNYWQSSGQGQRRSGLSREFDGQSFAKMHHDLIHSQESVASCSLNK